MEIKKSAKANLEKDITLNYLMGMVVGLAVLFVGFEWGETETEVNVVTGFQNVIVEEEIEASVQEEEPPPPPVEIPVVTAPEIINIVENTIVVEDIQFTSEDDATHAQVDTYVAPVGVIEEEEEQMDEHHVFVTVEKMPEFPGGDAALLKWINEHLVYPTIAQENGISGRVSCSFVVNADGSVTDAEVTRGLDPSCDKEALRVLRMLPKFKPGEQRGKPVRVKYSVPIRFQLNN